MGMLVLKTSVLILELVHLPVLTLTILLELCVLLMIYPPVMEMGIVYLFPPLLLLVLPATVGHVAVADPV